MRCGNIASDIGISGAVFLRVAFWLSGFRRDRQAKHSGPLVPTVFPKLLRLITITTLIMSLRPRLLTSLSPPADIELLERGTALRDHSCVPSG